MLVGRGEQAIVYHAFRVGVEISRHSIALRIQRIHTLEQVLRGLACLIRPPGEQHIVHARAFVVKLGRKIKLDRWGIAPVDQRAGDRRGLLAQLRISDGVDDARGLLRLGDGWHGRIRGETVEFAVGTLHHIDALDG